jgi:hypothetical protein
MQPFGGLLKFRCAIPYTSTIANKICGIECGDDDWCTNDCQMEIVHKIIFTAKNAEGAKKILADFFTPVQTSFRFGYQFANVVP